MKVKVSELSGPALDWAVATVEKLPLRRDPMGVGDKAGTYWVWPEGWPVPEPGYMRVGRKYSPSTNWPQGGPIIERELGNLYRRVNATALEPEVWTGIAYKRTSDYTVVVHKDGPTPLIAAMRCYVASKLGEEVEIPKELL